MEEGPGFEEQPQEDTIEQTSEPKESKHRFWKSFVDQEFLKKEQGEISEAELRENITNRLTQIDQELTRQLVISDARSELLNTDELSEISNEYNFNNDIEELIRNGESFGLLLMDIDDFKKLNTRYGHAGGDKAIKHLSKTLEYTLRHNEDEERQNDKVYRLHGDEKAIIVRNLNDPNDLLNIAERIRETVNNNPVSLSTNEEENLSISVGGAIYDNQNIDDFIDLVDKKALYGAKEKGKNNSYIIGANDQGPQQAA